VLQNPFKDDVTNLSHSRTKIKLMCRRWLLISDALLRMWNPKKQLKIWNVKKTETAGNNSFALSTLFFVLNVSNRSSSTQNLLSKVKLSKERYKVTTLPSVNRVSNGYGAIPRQPPFSYPWATTERRFGLHAQLLGNNSRYLLSLKTRTTL